ncbi:Serine/threonine-protein kinase ppk15 [Zea mays]|uniref:Serine/threonine-protein kinase ppk15 n=1 Tax=Zea mays TaxID=4577 RepID=A0A3L6FQ59_MAIZE|nr:Serine/threonine-protein kinase ppk15 [Zea mays]
MEESGGSCGKREDAAPPWRPSDSTAFGRFAAAASPPEASPSASANGAAARVSSLHGVRRKPSVARLTAGIIQTYLQCDPEFKYSEVLNPKRFLTNPSTPAHNDGLDNANWDLILYVNLELVNKMSNRRFIVKEMLGQGTFGQVVKCWDTETNDYVAVKVIKNQPAFYHQAIMEVSLLRTLNQKFDPDDQHNIVRMLDYLSFQNHLCIAFEMLGQNLYELLKRNHLRGLKLKYVQAFSKQILDAMVVMREAGIIHCDLKPENILLAPRGQPPDELLREAKNTARFFKHVGSIYPGNEAPTGLCSAYKSLSEEDVEVRDSKKPQMGKWYFPHLKLDKLICTYPWNNSELTDPLFDIWLDDSVTNHGASSYDPVGSKRKSTTPVLVLLCDPMVLHFDSETEKMDRLGLVDFLKGLLEFDPNKRWSPLQALYHPFITGKSFTGPYEPVPETTRIPVVRAAAIDHNPGGGHWLHSGLSPQVGSVNRYLPSNNAYPPKVPFSYGSSYGSFGSHGSYTANAGFGNSYGSIGDVNAINMYYSPLSSSGLTQIGSSPDVRLRMLLPHDRGIRLSPGSLGPMSLGASPSQFTPPNYQMQIPANSVGKHGSGSPASGGIHGSPLGKSAGVGPYNMRRNLPMPPHDYVSQHGHGRCGDGVSFSHSDACARGHTGHSHSAAGPSSYHSGWRPQIGSRSGISLEASSSHVLSQAPSQSFDFSPSSALDPANWDPNYSDESLLQDNSLSAELSSNLHFGDATGQGSGSIRSANFQGHVFATSNPVPTNQRADQLFHVSSQGLSAHSSVPINYGGYNPPNYPPQNLRPRRGQPILHQRYNQATSSPMRPMGSHHSGQPAWPSFGMGDGVPWGNLPTPFILKKCSV